MTNYGLDKMGKFDSRSRYVKRLHSRVMRRRRLRLIVLTLAISAVLVWFSVGTFNALKNFRFPKISLPQAAAPVTKKKESKVTIAVIGLEQRDYEQHVSGITVLVYSPAENKINGLSFSKDIRLQIPGYGLDVVQKSLFADTKAALSAITNVIGKKINRYVMIDSDDYAPNKVLKNKIFDSVYETNVSVKEQADYKAKFKTVSASDVNILEAPARLVAVGDKPYRQLKKKEVSRLVQILWDLPKPIKRKRVIVLNGVGTSGLAGKVAMKIIDSGYEVIDIKNANSFNYKNTLIIAYSAKMQKEALAIQKKLGYGNIMLELDKQGLTDMTIIIGKDYKKK